MTTDTGVAAIVEAPLPRLLLTPEQAAQVLSIGRTKLYELLRTGELQSVTIGASRRVRLEDLRVMVDGLGAVNDWAASTNREVSGNESSTQEAPQRATPRPRRPDERRRKD